MKNSQTRGLGAFTLVEIMIVVAIVGMLAAIAVPSFVRARARAQSASCVNTLRQIECGCQLAVFEKKLNNGAILAFPNDITNYIKLDPSGNIPSCPSGGTYSLLPVGAMIQSQCSYGTNGTPPHSLY
jgi:prepilin-type N-terminal cleavage/methylation domain-containing protein